MGKTAKGAIWLNADLLGAYEYWQFWRNTEDADVGRFLRLFTELPQEEISRLESLTGAELNDAKKVLATEATRMLHGKAAAEEAAETARRTFEEGALAEGLPAFEIDQTRIAEKIPVATLSNLAGLTSSASEARRLIQGGGLRVNDKVISDTNEVIGLADVTDTGVIKLSVGRKKHILVKPV
jgi:tyrosyl-tRNA synthetase